MPAKNATRQARKTQSPSAQAGEYVRQEIEHVREGKHGARSAKQVIAIGLSKARRAGGKLPPPPGEKPPQSTRRKPQPNRARGADPAAPAGEEAAAIDRSQAESHAIAGGAPSPGGRGHGGGVA